MSSARRGLSDGRQGLKRPSVRLGGEGRRLLVCVLHITRCKFVQIKPNHTNEISLDFLGVLWPILAFSKGYNESKQIFSCLAVSQLRYAPKAWLGSLAPVAREFADLIHMRGSLYSGFRFSGRKCRRYM